MQAPQETGIYFDVYPWIENTAERGYVPTVGIYRIAKTINTVAKPAILVTDEEALEIFANKPKWQAFNSARLKLTGVLGQNIEVISLSQARDTMFPVKLWLSLGVDCTTPALKFYAALEFKKKVRIGAILHDCMSYRGLFGEWGRTRFLHGLEHTDVLFYVSQSTLKEFDRTFPAEFHRKQFVPFPNCHHFPERVWQNKPRRFTDKLYVLSVHSVYPYKNIDRVYEVARVLNFSWFHIGMSYLENTAAAKTLAAKTDILGGAWMEHNVPDDVVHRYMSRAMAFVCASYDEGFSLPPMEAMICGADRLLLSDIPVHREVYGGYSGVTFFDPKVPVTSLTQLMPMSSLTEQDREKIFTKHSPENMLKGLLNYAQSC